MWFHSSCSSGCSPLPSPILPSSFRSAVAGTTASAPWLASLTVFAGPLPAVAKPPPSSFSLPPPSSLSSFSAASSFSIAWSLRLPTESSPSTLNLSGRIPELDGIRGIAIGMVLISHFFAIVSRPGSPLAYSLVPLRLDWSAVALFFVLSGFLIGGILLDARESSNYFRVFYTRRFFRIVPIYVVLLVSASFVRYLADAGMIRGYGEIFAGRLSWWYFPAFLQNIGMSIQQVWGTLPLAPAWSLAVEEPFYPSLS